MQDLGIPEIMTVSILPFSAARIEACAGQTTS